MAVSSSTISVHPLTFLLESSSPAGFGYYFPWVQNIDLFRKHSPLHAGRGVCDGLELEEKETMLTRGHFLM